LNLLNGLVAKKVPSKLTSLRSLPYWTRIFAIILTCLTMASCASLSLYEPNTKLYVFECGNIEVRNQALFSPGVDEGKVKQMTDSCYLIKHAKGTMIWDTGLSDSIGTQGIEKWEKAFYMNVTKPLGLQLEEIQIDPKGVDYIGISHFHSDHTGNANLFTNAKLIIQQEEFDAAFGAEPEKAGFSPETYTAIDRSKIKVISNDHDVFGDGTVVIKRAIGHTPGHQVLYVNLESTGPVLLSGDLYHFTKNRTHKRVPSFNFNKEQTIESMNNIEAFVEKTGAQLWIQHDLEQNKTIDHSPKFYQ